MEDALTLQLARLRLRVATSEDLVRAAEEALVAGYESTSLAILAGEKNPIWSDIEPLVRSAVADLGREFPDLDAACWTVLRHHVGRIAEGSVPPLAGMRTILDEVVYPGDLHSRSRHVLGDSHDLERLIGNYWQADDVLSCGSQLSWDGLRGDAALAAIEEDLRELARIWMAVHGKG